MNQLTNQENSEKKIEELPASNDNFWDGETHILKPKKIGICKTHSRSNWMDHRDYIDNRDGTIICKYCPWGAKIPGYFKVHEGRIVDLRSESGE